MGGLAALVFKSRFIELFDRICRGGVSPPAGRETRPLRFIEVFEKHLDKLEFVVLRCKNGHAAVFCSMPVLSDPVRHRRFRR